MTPPRTQTIVCLANSRKRAGRCVAGRCALGGRTARWLRPVSNRPHQELSEEEMRYVNGEQPKLLDLITIPLGEDIPSGYQTENCLIDPAYYWVRDGRASFHDLRTVADNVPRDLWLNGFSSAHGMNDRIPEQQTVRLQGSLLLISPEGMKIRVGVEGPTQKRKVRGEFFLNARRYQLSVTDPLVESAFLAKPDGEFPIGECFLCLSLSSLYEGFCYKLIASVITDAQP